MLLVQYHNTRTAFGYGRVDVRNRFAHHGAAQYHFGTVVGQAAGHVNQFVHRHAQPHPVVARLGYVVARDGDHAVDERFVLLYRLVDGEGRTHVLHDGSGRHGQGTVGHLLVQDGVDELFFAPCG